MRSPNRRRTLKKSETHKRKTAIKLSSPTDVRRRDLNSEALSNHYADVRRHTLPDVRDKK